MPCPADSSVSLGGRLPAPIQRITGRDPACLPTDRSALWALAQAAVNVELFTIPLYMVTMYSLHGMHEINAADQTFYKGRQWPGSATSRAPRTANELAFNIIFSVFIEEMLHLQLAANLSSVLGARPSFTSPMLQTEDQGWKVYGPDQTVIPHILDLRDTFTFHDIKVELGPLDRERIELFLAIEETEAEARRRIEPSKLDKYFPTVPFAGWTPDKTEADLPMFGTIGYMYECLAAYMTLEYSDGTTLFSRLWAAAATQRDLFNTTSPSHPMSEYPGFPAVVQTTDMQGALSAALDMIDAITDQGEGSKLPPMARERLSGRRDARERVEYDYRSSFKALRRDYPSYDSSGAPVPSADAEARAPHDRIDHYARFQEIKFGLLADVVTWDRWHRERGPSPWRPEDLLSGPDEASPKIPKVDQVAGALNRLQSRAGVFEQLSKVAAGAIAGVTTVLDKYWSGQTQTFPFPAMGGSGDRVSICWAVLGRAPDLALGTARALSDKLYHACQGLDFEAPGKDLMPDDAVYHTCIGSNGCKGQGGCGFVQSTSGGGSCSGGGGGCGTKIGAKNLCGAPTTTYSAPADNKCGGFGGCAVPISASQLYPRSGEMLLFSLTGELEQVGSQKFEYGDPVYDTAWRAYCTVLQASGQEPPAEPPPPDDLRLAFPPST